jgi:transcriptional regulator with XRE-family HTH domain
MTLTEHTHIEIKRIMHLRDISQVELARRLAVSEGQVSRMLKSDHNLTLASVERIAAALGVDVSLVMTLHSWWQGN